MNIGAMYSLFFSQFLVDFILSVEDGQHPSVDQMRKIYGEEDVVVCVFGECTMSEMICRDGESAKDLFERALEMGQYMDARAYLVASPEHAVGTLIGMIEILNPQD